MRKVAHFVCDHGKATPGFAGTGCFNGRIERQQVGLLRNAGDHFKDLPDVDRFGIQRLDMAAGSGEQLRQLLHRSDAAFNHLLALFSQAARIAGLM